MQEASPGAHSVQVSPHFFSLQAPANFDGPPSAGDADAPLDDEEDELLDDDELLDEPSSSSPPPLPLDDKSLDGSSYSTGFMRGPHATATRRTPTTGKARLKMLERFTGKLLDDSRDGTTKAATDTRPITAVDCSTASAFGQNAGIQGPTPLSAGDGRWAPLVTSNTYEFGRLSVPGQSYRTGRRRISGSLEQFAGGHGGSARRALGSNTAAALVGRQAVSRKHSSCTARSFGRSHNGRGDGPELFEVRYR